MGCGLQLVRCTGETAWPASSRGCVSFGVCPVAFLLLWTCWGARQGNLCLDPVPNLQSSSAQCCAHACSPCTWTVPPRRNACFTARSCLPIFIAAMQAWAMRRCALRQQKPCSCQQPLQPAPLLWLPGGNAPMGRAWRLCTSTPSLMWRGTAGGITLLLLPQQVGLGCSRVLSAIVLDAALLFCRCHSPQQLSLCCAFAAQQA